MSRIKGLLSLVAISIGLISFSVEGIEVAPVGLKVEDRNKHLYALGDIPTCKEAFFGDEKVSDKCREELTVVEGRVVGTEAAIHRDIEKRPLREDGFLKEKAEDRLIPKIDGTKDNSTKVNLPLEVNRIRSEVEQAHKMWVDKNSLKHRRAYKNKKRELARRFEEKRRALDSSEELRRTQFGKEEIRED